MTHSAPLITTLVAAFVLAFLFGVLANRLRVSPIVGYLVAGLAAGPYTPGYVADLNLAQQLAELGVILLMFGVGLHFSFDKLMEVRAISIPGAAGQVSTATLLGTGFGWLMGWPVAGSVVFGLCLSVASTVVLLRALEEQNLLQTRRGQIAVGWLIVEDIIMILALVLLPALGSLLGDAPQPLGARLGAENVAATVILTLVKVGLFMAVMVFAGRRVIPWILDRVAMTGSRELFTLSVLAVALGIAFVAAELAGASFALGAFFAGMVLAGSRLSQNAAERSVPFRDAFAVLFFVSAGMLFDPNIIATHALSLLAVVFIILIGKSLAAFGIVLAFGYPAVTAATVAISLAQVGEFSFILAGFALKLGMMPKDAHDLILGGAIISIMLNPLLFHLLRRYGKALERLDRPATRDDDILATPVMYDLAGHVIVVGYGRVGQRIAQELTAAGIPFVTVEANRDRVEKLEGDGMRVTYGNADRPEVLSAAGVKRARALLVAVPRGFDAGHVVALARGMNPGIQIIARAEFDAEAEHLRQTGAQIVLQAEQELAARMVASLPESGGDVARLTPAPHPA